MNHEETKVQNEANTVEPQKQTEKKEVDKKQYAFYFITSAIFLIAVVYGNDLIKTDHRKIRTTCDV